MSSLTTLPTVHPQAAGLDIGKSEIYAAVPPSADPQPVRVFGTFTPDLHALADWLVACSVTTVALESTGVYWIPVFAVLEGRGLEVCLVNASHIQRVPGRKSDFQDCEWLRQLHSLGLLAASFRPDAEMVTLRSYLRHRAELIQHRAPHILHMQKALRQMNLQLDSVLTDITGQTGLAILRAILAGERDPVKLAQLRHPNCHSPEETIAKALTGTWRAEHLFGLKQAMALFDFYTAQIAECDAEVARCFSAIRPRFTPPPTEPTTTPEAEPGLTVTAVRKSDGHSHSKNAPAGNVRAEIVRITAVDLCAVHGISASIAQTILSEIGTDMSRWPTVKHFCSWLRLAPRNDISGGKILKSRTLPHHHRAAQAFRLAAQAVSRADCATGAYYRRLRARLGPQQALVATAHKIARIVYCMLKEHQPYQDDGAEAYNTHYREHEVKALARKAAKLGFTVTPKAA
jgi:transposase